ncbi:(2Fe-2S)-binding protein [Burkholderia sp. Ac-20384]|uniref:(2Fe-2S)-binding protein n=1 Tax=Burkholderia sp. Ac-20384 TaxID=2703902 RepID=UPI00197EA7FC|nr:(2Fe-2S)-binding protein [Burkholderia sp. Ac-20384]MBN3823154.1 (2Fe-2S)-binding protein [Burkholderia sp. Ac-20384]
MLLHINGKTHEVRSDGDTPLLWAIRDELGLTGTKYGCGLAQCGACSVLVDGTLMRSCVTPIEGVAGRRIMTIEAIEEDEIGERVVAAWVRHQVPQCGYCQSGQVMAATALLKQNPHPTDEQIASAMINLCRCGTYNAIRAAMYDLSGSPTAQADADRLAGPAVPNLGTAATATMAGIAIVSMIAREKPGTDEDARGDA